MASKGVLGLDAVVLIADDFAGQVRFYKDVLGLELLSSSSETAFFRMGAQKLAIFSREHHPEGTRRLGGATHGISHLEFSLSESEMTAMANKLREAGFHTSRDLFQDADGNLFHFNRVDVSK